jgi:two-component system, OmpR family, response regulator
MRILVIDDDEHLADAVRRGLRAGGFAVDVALDGTDGLWQATECAYDAIVCDIMLPGMSGYRLCQELRAGGNWTPILMLTAKDGDLDEAEALDAGADDYLTKPFSYTVLVARVRALLRRAAERSVAPTEVGDLRVDRSRRRAWRGEREVALTAREFDVLEALVRRAGQVLSKYDLLDDVWQSDFDGDPNIVEVYVRRLRRKVDDPFGRRSIETVRGAGYRVVADGG